MPYNRKPKVRLQDLGINDIGLTVLNEKVELFANNLDDATKRRAETVALKLINTLPHTPFGAFGINFNFIEMDPDEQIFDALKTRDKINQHYKILRENFTSTIEIADGVELNFSRRPTDKDVTFDFNYHHPRFSVESANSLISNSIDKYLNSSLEALKTLYQLKKYNLVKHEFDKISTTKEKSHAK